MPSLPLPKDVEDLAEYFEREGETESVGEIESALEDTWQTSRTIAADTGYSATFARKVCLYLAATERAQYSAGQRGWIFRLPQ